MSLFGSIKYYYEQAKEKIQSSINALWTSYYVQSFYQGITAPIYSRTAIQKMWKSSQFLREQLEDSAQLNGNYAAQSLALYFIYYRIFPMLHGESKDISDHVIGSFEFIFYCSMIAYLATWHMPYNFRQSLVHTSNIVTIGEFSAPESEVPSCECKDKKETKALMQSTAFYMVMRYGTKTASDYFSQQQNSLAWIASFVLESMGFGYSLLEYKLAAVKTCGKHRLQVLLRDNKLYGLWFGASFVSVLWFFDYLGKKITDAPNNIFFYDALFNFFFNFFVVTSLAREEKFPGGGKPRFDLLGVIKYLLTTSSFQSLYEKYERRYAFDDFVKSKAVGTFFSLHEDNILRWVSTGKETVAMLENLQSTAWFPYVEWLLKPIVQIPEVFKGYFKDGYLTSKFNGIEKIIFMARDAERLRFNSKRNEAIGLWAQSKEDITDMNNIKDYHFINRNPSFNNIQDGWTEVTENKTIPRNHSTLFKPRPLSDAAKKLLENLASQKNIEEVTRLETTSKYGVDRQLKKRS